MRFKNKKQQAAVMMRIGLSDKQKKRLSSPRSTVNPTSKRELELFTENDEQIYRQRIVPIQNNLKKKWNKGDYDIDKAQLLWTYAVDDAVKKYNKDTKGDFDVFTKADKLAVAKSLERGWRDELRREYPRKVVLNIPAKN